MGRAGGAAGTGLVRSPNEPELLLVEQHTVDRVQHGAQASSYFRHLNPKYTVSFGFQPCLPAQVVCGLRLVPMDGAVDFDRQSRRMARSRRSRVRLAVGAGT